MAWESEVESPESQTMFISHIYATGRVHAGKAILVYYGRSLHTGMFRALEMSLVLRMA